MTNKNVGVEWNLISEFETTSRLVAAIVNEGLALATVTHQSMKNNLGLHIRSGNLSRHDESVSIWIGLDANLPYDTNRLCLLQILYPDDLTLPLYFWDDAPQPGT